LKRGLEYLQKQHFQLGEHLHHSLLGTWVKALGLARSIRRNRIKKPNI
jgi:hypothetical protein